MGKCKGYGCEEEIKELNRVGDKTHKQLYGRYCIACDKLCENRVPHHKNGRPDFRKINYWDNHEDTNYAIHHLLAEFRRVPRTGFTLGD